MGAKNRSLAITLVSLCVLIVLGWLPLGETKLGENATLTDVKHSAEIRSGTSDTWRITVYNNNCSENDTGNARFFLEFYLEDKLYFDEYNSTAYKTWPCAKGETVTYNFRISGLSATRPISNDFRINLYSFCDNTARLEDTTSFRIGVTVLIPLQHIYATGYLAAYLIAFFLLLAYDHVTGLED